MKVFYCGLEKYESRYTLQLTQWAMRGFERNGMTAIDVPGITLSDDGKIVHGRVLDAHGRTHFAMTQMASLVNLLSKGAIGSDDAIFLEDMFTPGIESLFYIMNQTPPEYQPNIFVRCLAQTIDPDDFVWDTGMVPWMREFERMVANGPKVHILASNEEMVAHWKIANLGPAPVYNISGLTFDRDEVRGRVAHITPFAAKEKRVVFASRFDSEKNPHFFLDVAEELLRRDPTLSFAVLCGKPFGSNDQSAVYRARELECAGRRFRVHQNLTKNQYYEILNSSRVLFNCALQDWTSNTISEADALGCNVVFPAYRSFPEITANSRRMYLPWNFEDAVASTQNACYFEHEDVGKISEWTNNTMDRICDILKNREASRWYRGNTNYRKHTIRSKY